MCIMRNPFSAWVRDVACHVYKVRLARTDLHLAQVARDLVELRELVIGADRSLVRRIAALEAELFRD
jgi:hypothetical protein